ncbi:response regulator [Tenacibaculum caenipelagi]|uniref:LuxR family two component transcriptional regulator n=1 Tax=Tenacibaculum caenipelagi TaxID=1325435 RepID=A0A4R6TIK8_9FLAO|nr:response regulator transcription factor [Tenacibaculum caenipelagi]TDQ28582.1 LuxR family two component transcriptional regulator [Tenacibaculum caenipelagi]
MTNILIIEDNTTLLNTFVEIINLNNNYNVVGAFTSYESIPNDFNITNVDILITDIQLPGINGIQGLKKLKKVHPKLIAVVITVHEDSEYVFDALCAGAVGYLVKNLDPLNLIHSLEQAKNGGAPMSANIARKVVESFSTKPAEKTLTKRENDVLQLLAKGKSYPSIAKELFISLNTVKGHTKKIYEKLQLKSKQEIIEKYNTSFK